MSDRITLGSFEVVSLPKLGLDDVIAKIDTGAYSGAVHCTDIVLKNNEDTGVEELCFVPAGQKELACQTTNFTKRHVRSSNGQLAERYIISTEIIINGKTYQTDIGLSDRSDMKKQVLIGRRFLRQHDMLVDVTMNVQYDDRGEISV